jgi:hypothetical protein
MLQPSMQWPQRNIVNSKSYQFQLLHQYSDILFDLASNEQIRAAFAENGILPIFLVAQQKAADDASAFATFQYWKHFELQQMGKL